VARVCSDCDGFVVENGELCRKQKMQTNDIFGMMISDIFI